jgi:hypothetical protein
MLGYAEATRMDDLASVKEAVENRPAAHEGVTRTPRISKTLMYNTHFTIGNDSGRHLRKDG